ncbi:MAG: hypothetical protein JXB13_15415 [Phycisphaerae bacterium]|nr:hypothetical protein [Phycisphaerae bacterium]
MFFPRRVFQETIEVVGTLSISAGIFILLNRHIPLWAAAVVAVTALVASIWAGV